MLQKNQMEQLVGTTGIIVMQYKVHLMQQLHTQLNQEFTLLAVAEQELRLEQKFLQEELHNSL